ncbi:MAG: hypothetical protein LQ349_002090 [Xanthoria aureola]|nr:MAG: hypothetical protein LQ349_002090 [Xanthoria aureola]
MASAKGTALGINELISSILSYLPKKDLKSARRVNKIWASLGGQMLIGTLYISPREIDMAAFDGVTQHQDLSKSVKHLVYDTAQFIRLDSFDEYYKELARAERAEAFLHLGTAQSKNHWSDPTFIEPYEQYRRYASESANPFGSLWSARVARGLKALGEISSFAVENAWEAIYWVDGFPHYKDFYDPWSQEGYIASPVLEDTSNPNINRLIDSALITPDGRRLIGSPSARAWDPAGVPPISPIVEAGFDGEPRTIRKARSKVGIFGTGPSDSYWELFEVLKLLNAVNKMPRQFRAWDNLEVEWRYLIDRFSPILELAVDFAANLKVLELNLVPRFGPLDYEGFNPNHKWMRKAEAVAAFLGITQEDGLEVLSVSTAVMHYTGTNYWLNAFIGDIDAWIRPNLTTLRLGGFCVSSRDLHQLLFFNLPRLRDLGLGRMALYDGIWDDVVEGMHQILELKVCNLLGPFGQRCLGVEHITRRYQDFNEASQRYVLEGGVHPGSPEYVSSQDFLEQIARWEELRRKDQ